MRKLIARIAIVMVAVLLVPFLTPVATLAATTANVTINATPEYVSITNSPDNYGFGIVAASSNTSTAIDYFTITNGSTVNVNITVGVTTTTWSGGVTWAHDDTGTAGVDTAALYATPNTAAWNIIVKNAGRNNLYANTGEASPAWGLRLVAPTEFGDGALKEITVQLTVAKA